MGFMVVKNMEIMDFLDSEIDNLKTNWNIFLIYNLSKIVFSNL